MSLSIKLDGNNFIDASGVWNSSLNKTQSDINNPLWVDLSYTPGMVSPVCAKYKKVDNTNIIWVRFSGQTATTIGGSLCTISLPVALPYSPMRAIIIGDIPSAGRVAVNLDFLSSGQIHYYPGIYNQYTGEFMTYIYGDAYFIF